MNTGRESHHVLRLAGVTLAAIAITGCGSSGSGTARAPAPPADITVSGVVSDGPVIGGRLFGYLARDIGGAVAAAGSGGDRGASLAAANPVVSIDRSVADLDGFSFTLGGEHAGQPLFLVFDSAGSQDLRFGDVPPNLESAAIIGSPGSNQTINVSLHTSLVARIVRAGLDPESDGLLPGAAAIGAAMQAAELDVIAAVGRDDDGDDLFGGERPVAMTDSEMLHEASSVLGQDFRSAAVLSGLSVDEVIEAIAADLGDGALDGLVPSGHSGPIETAASGLRVFLARGGFELDTYAQGPCSASAVVLRRACALDVVDDHFEGRAVCANIADDDARAECLTELRAELTESTAECSDVFNARLAVCSALNDAPHEPAFGPDFATNFVDPREIGSTVTPNPFLPLVPGTTWVYQGSFYDEEADEYVAEEVTVTVTDRIKLIGDIPCIVVNDVVVSDDGAMEDTDDWIAQDVDGNVWYCGEISRDYEEFDGDEPVEFELVATEGSWKHGRDGAEAGILLPALPVVGETIRQEVLFGEAEDVIEIVSVTGTESAPGGACTGDCLVTLDFTPLSPDAEENKYYAPGIGMIVEVDLATGDRLELVEFTQP